MKALLLVTSLVLALGASAQKAIKVSEVNENLGGGSHAALSVIIYEVDVKHVDKAWMKEMKHLHAKTSHQSGEMFGDNARIKDLGDNTFDIYAKAKKVDDHTTELIVAVDLGGAFMDSQHGDKLKRFKKLLHEFAVDLTKDAIKDEIKEEEKTLKHLNKDQSHLENDNKKLHKNIEGWEKDIEQAKKDIEQAKKDIETNLKDQETKKGEISVQEKVVAKAVEKEKAVK